MPDKKLTELVAAVWANPADLLYLVANPGSTPVDLKIPALSLINSFRGLGEISREGTGSVQTITGSVWNTITKFDTNGLGHLTSPDSANNQILLDAGVYLVSFGLKGTYDQDGSLTFRVNVATVGQARSEQVIPTLMGELFITRSFMFIGSLAPLSALKLEVYPNPGGDLTVEPGATFIQAVKVF
jgi:hypothetical protein